MQVDSNDSLLNNLHAYTLAERIREGQKPFSGADCGPSMELLKEKRPEAYFTVLGCFYDVAVYPVTGEGVTADCPPEEIGMYFAATNVGDFENAPEIPLMKTENLCYQTACRLLGLERLFEAECRFKMQLPRRCPVEDTSITDLLPHIITQVRRFDKLDTTEMHMKLSEENGEFAEALLVERGKLPGKKLKEPAMGEGADVIIATICTLAKHYPDLSPEQLAAELSKWVNIKMNKYEQNLLYNAGLLTSAADVVAAEVL
jgi:hypothetical protein